MSAKPLRYYMEREYMYRGEVIVSLDGGRDFVIPHSTISGQEYVILVVRVIVSLSSPVLLSSLPCHF